MNYSKYFLFLLSVAAAGGAYYAFHQIGQQEQASDYRQKITSLTSEVDQVTVENKKLAASNDQLSQSLSLTRNQMDDLTTKIHAYEESVKPLHPTLPPPVTPTPAPVQPAPVVTAPTPPVADVVASPDSSDTDQVNPPVLSAKWREVYRIAKEFVDKESPPSVWPFKRLSPQDSAQSTNKVFSHYFTPFPLSIDNRSPDADYYQIGFMLPTGEGGKHAASGGFLRERPLSPGPQNSPDWTEVNYAIEILRAQRMGLDGFTCDMLSISPSNTWKRMLELMDTAAAIAPNFHIVLMPDMEAEIKSHPELLEDVLFQLAKNPSVFKLADGRLLVAPYDAQRQSPSYWKKLFADLKERGVATAFLPLFQGWNRYAQDYASISYGFSDWGPRAVDSSANMANAASAAAAYVPVWMMPVAPQDMRPKSGIYNESGNTLAYRELWQAAINSHSAYVQLITWNDYSEHAEVSPSSGTQFLFYDLGAYYTAWFKGGHPPQITKDAIYYCHRTQILPLKEPPSGQTTPFRVVGGTPQMNQIEMVAMLTAPARLEIEINGKVQGKEAGAGLTTFSIPAAVGQPDFRIMRDGAPVVEVHSAWTIVDHAKIEDPLYHGGSSTRPFVQVGPRPPTSTQ